MSRSDRKAGDYDITRQSGSFEKVSHYWQGVERVIEGSGPPEMERSNPGLASSSGIKVITCEACGMNAQPRHFSVDIAGVAVNPCHDTSMKRSML